MSGQPKPVPKGHARRAAGTLPPAAQPLYARLRDQLRADILEGRLGPHEQLPSENELTGRFGMSRITVRQALAELHREGLIVKVHGKGSFVAPPRVSPELSRLRGLSEALAGEGHEVRARPLRFEDVPAPAAAALRLAIVPGAPVTELLSLRYLDREPLSLNHSYIVAALGARLRKADVARSDIVTILENEFGLRLGRAEVEISAGAADRQHARYLRVDEGAPVLCVDRLVLSADEQPLFLETSRYRSDAFSYRLTLQR